MITLRQILTLKSNGHSNRALARMLGISKTTILKYVRSALASGQSYESLLSLRDDELDLVLSGAGEAIPSDRLLVLQACFPRMEQELKRVGVTRQRLWTEYKSEHPQGYNYSQFCHHYRQWKQAQQAVMHFEHKAGDKLYVDYAGKKLRYQRWPDGEEVEVDVFVAVLGASQYTYVEASASQQSEDFIHSNQNALHFYGGVPRAIVSDNLKSGVTRSSRYEPQINQTFEDFGNHYGAAILPARPHKPRDKSLVENAVRQVYQQIYAAIRDQVFYSLEGLNQAIAELLPAYNARHFQGKDHSRKELFEAIEQEALSPLPAHRYVIKHYARAKVGQNCHVHLSEDKHYYSVPHRYIGQRVRLIYTRDQVEIYANRQRIAFHHRDKKRFGYSSIPEHLPSHHRFILTQNAETYLEWADKLGAGVRNMIDGILERRPHPEQAYRSCRGVLALAKKVGPPRLNLACERAISFNSYSYRTVKNILDQGIEAQPPDPSHSPTSSHIPEHPNVRGNQYYQ